VRINAAVALGSITSRASLGSHFLPVFRGLVTSLETAQNFEVFGEWQHQANLGKAAFIITVLRIRITLVADPDLFFHLVADPDPTLHVNVDLFPPF
jgi:hypothetical protein